MNGNQIRADNLLNQPVKIRSTQIFGIALLAAGLALSGYKVFQLARPVEFEATTKVKINLPAVTYPGNEPDFVETTFEIIRSQLVLSNIITTFKLDEVWSKKYFNGKLLSPPESRAFLNSHLKLVSLGSTRWSTTIAIGFTSENPDEAVRLANAIARAYSDYHQAEHSSVEIIEAATSKRLLKKTDADNRISNFFKF